MATKTSFMDDETELYDVHDAIDYDSDDDSEYNESLKQKQKYKLASEYDRNDDEFLDESENRTYDERDKEYEDIGDSQDDKDSERMMLELEELDKEDLFYDDDDEDDTDETNGMSYQKPKPKGKRTTRSKKGKKTEKIDNSGAAVRERFYEIMKDFHSDDTVRRQDALERAMKELEGFIHLIIKRSYSTYTRKYFYDLLQEGYLGVAIGMEKYEPDKSMPTTFFYPYIKHEMQGFITKNVDKTTSHYSANIKKINKAIQEFEEKGIRYTNVDIAIQTGMTIETVDQSMAIRNYRDEVHIDACPPNVIDNEMEEIRNMTPEQQFIEDETKNIIYQTVNTLLNEDEIRVLELHFGLNDVQPVSEGEISKQMNIPKDKVKRLLNRAIRKLRNSELANIFGDNVKKEEKFLEDIEVSYIARDATESDIEFLSQIDDICD